MAKERNEGMGGGQVSADELRLLIERWERLDEERQNIVADQKDVMAEAKSRGFDPKIMREIIKLRKMEPDARREREALIDTYRAALGMLDGTPLGRWAVERLEPHDDENGDGATEVAPATDDQPETVEDARAAGSAAARAGKPVTSNPFPARDVRRAAFDEAWCSEIGSDGMDIPDAWKPASKKAPPKEAAE